MADRGGGPVQIVAGNLAPVIAQFAQPRLKTAHVLAAVSLFQRAMGVAIDQLLKVKVGDAGRLQPVCFLDRADGLARRVQVVASHRAGIIAEVFHPRLKQSDFLALVAVAELPAFGRDDDDLLLPHPDIFRGREGKQARQCQKERQQSFHPKTSFRTFMD